MNKIKTAVIGVGHLGKEHARIYTELPQSELVCVIDSNASQAEKIGQKWNVPFYTRIEDLPESVEAVSLATPTTFHHGIALKLLEKKIHLLIEKPIACMAEEARELVEKAKEKKVILQVGHIERFNPGFLGIRERIQNPSYIQVTRISPYSFRSTDISVLHDVLIHDLDLILNLIPSGVESAEAFATSILSPQDDMVQARLRFQNGVIADFTASRVSMKMVRELKIFQKNCAIFLDYAKKKASIYSLSPDYTCDKIKGVDISKGPAYLQELVFSQFIRAEELSFEGEEPLKVELRSFLESIQENKPIKVPGEAGLKALEVIELLLKNMKRIQ